MQYAAEHLAEQPEELLPDWESFVRWTVQVGLIEPELYGELVDSPSPIDEVWELREEIYHVGLTLAMGDPVAEDDLVAVREEANAPKPMVVSEGGGRLHWRPDPQFASRGAAGDPGGRGVVSVLFPEVGSDRYLWRRPLRMALFRREPRETQTLV